MLQNQERDVQSKAVVFTAVLDRYKLGVKTFVAMRKIGKRDKRDNHPVFADKAIVI